MVIKGMCMAGNILVQVSPFPQVKRWEHRKDTGEADAAPYLSIAFGGWQWCFYGSFAYIVTQRTGFLILLHSNFLGAILGTYYIFAFYKNCKDASAKASLQKYLGGVSALVLLQTCGLLALPPERALFLSGLISSFCSFVGALSMLVTVPTVLRTQNSRSIPGMLVFANLLSAICWCICGYLLADMLVMCPNIISSISSVICLYLKAKYPDAPEACSLLVDKKAKKGMAFNYGSADGFASDFGPESRKRKKLADANDSISMNFFNANLPQQMVDLSTADTGGTL